MARREAVAGGARCRGDEVVGGCGNGTRVSSEGGVECLPDVRAWETELLQADPQKPGQLRGVAFMLPVCMKAERPMTVAGDGERQG